MVNLFEALVDSLKTAGVAGTHVKIRIGEVSVLDAHAGKRISDDLDALILEVDTKALAGIEEWPRSRGLEVYPEIITAGPSGRTRLVVQLLDRRYRQVFLALCNDLCHVLIDAENPQRGVHIFHNRLFRWQSFLQRHGHDGLSEEARCGLFGELLVLRDFIIPNIAIETALQSWRGCKKANQDFQFPDRALEVKTTRAAIPERVYVSNIQQLDSEGMERFVLAVVHVHENETVGETLPEMVSSLRTVVSDDCLDLLESGFEEVGYSDIHQDSYSKTRYQHLDTHYFEVCEGFPCLSRALIPEGVKGVRYEISFDACKPFGVSRDTAISWMNSIGSVADRD